MKEIKYDKTHKGPTIKIVLGIMALALLMLISIAVAVDPVAAAGTGNKVIKNYTPNYANCAVIDIENGVKINGVKSDIVVSWAKTGSKKAIFQAKIPKGQTRTVTAPAGTYDQYVHTGGVWYKVTTGRIVVKCGYKYTMKYYTVVKYTDVKNKIKYDGTGFKRIPDSQAPKI